ncbi:helix-turn-helix transcriptional regulator [Vibrio cholerae]|nr:helix-turn-helix transcriptional regulator [Vibrio cholerae]
MAINGKRLEEIREQKNIKRNFLAQAIAVSPSIITVAESKDQHEFKLATGIALCKTLDVSYEYLSGEADLPAPYIYARKTTENQNLFDVVNTSGEVVSQFFVSNIHMLRRTNAGIPVVGDTETGPEEAYINGKFPNHYGHEYINMPSDGSMYVLRISSSTKTNLGRTGDGLLVSNAGGADTGDDVIYKHQGTWKMATILMSRNGTLTLELNGQRDVVSAFDIELIHRICGSVTTSMFCTR